MQMAQGGNESVDEMLAKQMSTLTVESMDDSDDYV